MGAGFDGEGAALERTPEIEHGPAALHARARDHVLDPPGGIAQLVQLQARRDHRLLGRGAATGQPEAPVERRADGVAHQPAEVHPVDPAMAHLIGDRVAQMRSRHPADGAAGDQELRPEVESAGPEAQDRTAQGHALAPTPHGREIDPAAEVRFPWGDTVSRDPEPQIQHGLALVPRQRPRHRLRALESDHTAVESVRRHRIEGPRPSGGANAAAKDMSTEPQVGAAAGERGVEVEVAHVGVGHARASQPQGGVPVGQGEGLAADVGLHLAVDGADRRRAMEPRGIQVLDLPPDAIHCRRAMVDDRAALQVDGGAVEPRGELRGDQASLRRRTHLEREVTLGRDRGVDAGEIGQRERARLQLHIQLLRQPGGIEAAGKHGVAGDVAPMAADAERVEAEDFGRGLPRGGEGKPEGRLAGRRDLGAEGVQDDEEGVAHDQIPPEEAQAFDSGNGIGCKSSRHVHAADREAVHEEVAASGGGVARGLERPRNIPAVGTAAGCDGTAVEDQLTQAAIGSAKLERVVASAEMLDAGQLAAAPVQHDSTQLQARQPVAAHPGDLESVAGAQRDEGDQAVDSPGRDGGDLKQRHDGDHDREDRDAA